MQKKKDPPPIGPTSTQQPTTIPATKAEPDGAQETRDRKDSIVSPKLSGQFFHQFSCRLSS